MSLAIADIFIIAISVIVTILAGLSATWKKKSKAQLHKPRASSTEYILAGRKLTAPLFAASLTATWYGSVLGSGEFISRYGVSFILCFGIPYYIMAIIYALLLSKQMRRSDSVSIPDLIKRSFGAGPGYASAVVMLFITVPAAYMLSMGLLLHSIFHVPIWIGVIGGTVVSLFIVAKGGLASDVRANVVQVSIMFAGFGALAAWCVIQFGSISSMWQFIPTVQQNIPGILGWQAVTVWFLISLQTFVDPNFHVRSAAAITPGIARKGLLISVVSWIIFDGLQLLVGLYAVAYLHTGNNVDTFFTVAEAALPIAWKGLFVAAVFAAVMSTLDGYALVSATTIGHDVIDSIRGKGHSRTSLLIGLAITGIVGVFAAILIPSIVDLIYNAASITVPALLIPVYVAVNKPRFVARFKHMYGLALAWIVLPAIVALLTFAVNAIIEVKVEPMLSGLAASLLIMLIIWVRHATEARKR